MLSHQHSLIVLFSSASPIISSPCLNWILKTPLPAHLLFSHVPYCLVYLSPFSHSFKMARRFWKESSVSRCVTLKALFRRGWNILTSSYKIRWVRRFLSKCKTVLIKYLKGGSWLRKNTIFCSLYLLEGSHFGNPAFTGIQIHFLLLSKDKFYFLQIWKIKNVFKSFITYRQRANDMPSTIFGYIIFIYEIAQQKLSNMIQNRKKCNK